MTREQLQEANKLDQEIRAYEELFIRLQSDEMVFDKKNHYWKEIKKFVTRIAHEDFFILLRKFEAIK